VMSEQKVPRSMEQRIVIKFLVGQNVPSAEIHHRLQQQYGEESQAAAQCGLFTHKSVPVIFEPPCIITYGMSIPSAVLHVLSAVFFCCSHLGNNCQSQPFCVLSGLMQHVSAYQRPSRDK